MLDDRRSSGIGEGLDYFYNCSLSDFVGSRVSIERDIEFKLGLGLLTNEAKKVVGLVLDTPSELLDEIRNKKQFPGNLSSHDLRKFLRRKGWKIPTIEFCFREIRGFLKKFKNNDK